VLPPDRQARVELELAQVCELADPDGNAHLLATVAERVPPDDVPAGLALALWFLLYHPEEFREVFFHHEVRDAHAWRSGKGPPGASPAHLIARAGDLRDALRAFFRRAEGSGRFCAVDAHALPDSVWFVVRVADRVHLLEGFADDGEPALHRVRPAVALAFAYDPADGSVLLKSPLRAADRVDGLFRCFGQSVLGGEVTCGEEVYDLDRLKGPCPLPVDAPDMELARVRVLHLRYPARLGRRLLKLETLASDTPTAIGQLLRSHAGDAEELSVTYAELQVRLFVAGRARNVPVRLWRDRSSLGRTPLGDRLRRCLVRWGLCGG
jgi:hypothetical protein